MKSSFRDWFIAQRPRGRLRDGICVLLVLLAACGPPPEDGTALAPSGKGENPPSKQRYFLFWGHSLDVDLERSDRLSISKLADLDTDVVVREGCDIGEPTSNLTPSEAALFLPQNNSNGSAFGCSSPAGNGGLSLAMHTAWEHGLKGDASHWAYEFRSGYAGFFRMNQYHWARLISVARDRLRAANSDGIATVTFHCVYNLYKTKNRAQQHELEEAAAEHYQKRQAFWDVEEYVDLGRDFDPPRFIDIATLRPYRQLTHANAQLEQLYRALPVDARSRLRADLAALNYSDQFRTNCFKRLDNAFGPAAPAIFPTHCGQTVHVTAQTELTRGCQRYLAKEQATAAARRASAN
ncbi:MAG: hypothetical protein H6707_17910 [Deltaproteobacteria bacterium]|nr:hypothetical protein [Deltaproteobacteria bacterium]